MARKQAPRTGVRPSYELRARKRGPGDLLLEVWQLPSLATPGMKEPLYVGGLGGRNFALVDHRVLKQLRLAGVDVGPLRTGEATRRDLEEELALRLALTFRALAPMRNRASMRAVADGIDGMAREEAAYWLGMAMHRRYPRRVLMALRCLLVEPRYFR
ncbi:MAG: hypothetical protein AB7P99_10130 [Vicinamibacterales bacterium]